MSAQSPWKLDPEIARDTQGLVRSGYVKLQHGKALFLALPEKSSGAWLANLLSRVSITPAIKLGGGASKESAAAIAFTWTGLKRMGLADNALASFSAPFREGMFQEDRLRRLGDRRKAEWLDSVIPGGPIWSGNTEQTEPFQPIEAYSAGKREETAGLISTPITVHVMLTLYGKSSDAIERLVEEVETGLRPHDVSIVHQLSLTLDSIEGKNFSREHFGFADGISQPIPFDKYGAVLTSENELLLEADAVHGVPLGEFLIGYENGHREFAPGPVVPGDVVGNEDDRPAEAGLLPHPKASGFYDFGKNGSYMVVRQLSQDVAAFWSSLDRAVDDIKAHEPDADHITAEWLAERIVGRTKDGHILRKAGPLPASTDGAVQNDVLFYKEDPHGLGCPLGSHVRRSNPRDGLTPYPEYRQTLLDAANNHRILRRGRNYGPKPENDRVPDDEERGLLFVCLNTDIARQFEFTQQTWLFNSDFSTLFEEVDPLVGPDGHMTIPDEPLRRRIAVETFVRMSGGEYFFLPSMPALKYLAML